MTLSNSVAPNNNISRIIITDTHFGKKNNSTAFFKSQKTFFDSLVEKIVSLPEGTRVDLIHAGDLFDSRSTVNIYILHNVMALMGTLVTALRAVNPKNKVVLIAGNHDFFSPVGDTVNSLDTVIAPVFRDQVLVVSKEEIRDPDDQTVMYVPWFRWNEHMDELDFSGVKTVFTHTDLHMWCFDERVPLGVRVYSGHIHQKRMYRNGMMVNIPAPYGMDFSDVNDNEKGAYWMDDKGNLSLWLRNDTSIKFRSRRDSQIFDIPDIDESIERGDNYNIYLSQTFRNNQKVSERINELRECFRYINIIPVSDEARGESDTPKTIDTLDIEKILRESLPDTLRERFDMMIGQMNENSMDL